MATSIKRSLSNGRLPISWPETPKQTSWRSSHERNFTSRCSFAISTFFGRFQGLNTVTNGAISEEEDDQVPLTPQATLDMDQLSTRTSISTFDESIDATNCIQSIYEEAFENMSRPNSPQAAHIAGEEYLFGISEVFDVSPTLTTPPPISDIRRIPSRSSDVESQDLTALPALPPNARCTFSPPNDSAVEVNHGVDPRGEKTAARSPSPGELKPSCSGLSLLIHSSREKCDHQRRMDWFRTLVVCLLAAGVTMAASILDVAMRFAVENFGTSAQVRQHLLPYTIWRPN
jgi:hypothetical protein